MPGTARSKYGVSAPAGRRCVRGGAGTAKLSAVASIWIVNTGNWEVWMVKEIEEFRSELGGEPFLEFPLLRDREIHVVISWAPEDVAIRVTNGSKSRRGQNAGTLYKAAKICEGGHGELLELRVA